MWSRLICFARRLVLLAGCAALMVGQSSGLRAGAAPAAEVKHGLTGSYYIATLETHEPKQPQAPYFVQVWYDPNDFELPKPFTSPAAVRVDSQIAFGKNQGFVPRDGKQFVWWPTDYSPPAGWTSGSTEPPWKYTAAVIWKGYIRLPKAGTYYLATASKLASAVYLNQARVALNGVFGGYLSSDAFAYPDPAAVQNASYGGPSGTYVVPVTVEAPRDFPIEVHYNMWSPLTRVTNGIDLYWVTPDSPRDASGKPIAEIVPSAALYTVAPAPIETPLVRGASSTISADHLYFPTEYTENSVTLTIRLADKDGNPVAGKRVHVSSLVNYGNSDAIVQPGKPTDEKGETTAQLRATATSPVPHDSTIFATDVTDLVDVAQVAHVTFQSVPNSFFPDALSPYYDQRFSVTPLPPVVGRPATIKTMLKNSAKWPAIITVTFLTTDLNIGLANWAEIAKVKDLTLQPGESRLVSTTFTPREVMSHKCYRVEISGRYIAMTPSGRMVFAAVLVPAAVFQNTALAAGPGAAGSPCPSWQLWPPCDASGSTNPSDQVPEGSQQINSESLIGKLIKKIEGGTVPICPICSYDPSTGKTTIGLHPNIDVNGHDVGGIDVKASWEPGSHDPHDLGKVGVTVGGHIGPYEGDVIDVSGTVPVPAIHQDIDPNTSPLPQYRQLQQLNL